MRRYTPFEEFETLFERMGQGFDAGWFDSARSARAFEVDVRVDDEQVVVMADLPGFERDDIDVSLDDRTLTVSAERVAAEVEEDDDYVRRERRHRETSRSIRLPAAVDEDAATATYNNGVLTVTLPRIDAGEDEDAHHIDVE
ncbi:MAG: Hsp20/alpha crystallin family protein [Haloferacaceae archaeon]